MGHVIAGVTVIAAELNHEPTAMTATSVTSVSLEPPTVLVCLNRRARTCDAVLACGRFTVSILNDQQVALARRFGTPGRARSYDAELVRSSAGLPLIANAVGHLECEVAGTLDAGTHAVVLGQVARVVTLGGRPLARLKGRFLTNLDQHCTSRL